jgi:hypothetical protein
LYRKNDRAHQREVTRAASANDRLILDRFDAKRTFHFLPYSKPTMADSQLGSRTCKLVPKLLALEQKFAMFS